MIDFGVHLFVLCILIIHLNSAITTTKRCSTNLGNGIINQHCCDNHEDRNSTCVECEDGFKSETGEPCYKCPYGTFGRKCSETCFCTEYERCHHVKGCLNYSTGLTSISSILTDGASTTAKNSRSPAGRIGKMSDEIMIYIICTSGVTFVLTLCMVSVNRYRKRQNRNTSSPLVRYRNGNDENALEMNELEGEYERIYDTVDESQMINMPIHNDEQNDGASTDSSENDKLQSLDDHGYLNPYQPIIQNIEHHDYCSQIGEFNMRDTNEILNGSYECSSAEFQQSNTAGNTSGSHQRISMEQMKSSEYLFMQNAVPRYVQMNTLELPIDKNIADFKRIQENQLSEILVNAKTLQGSKSQTTANGIRKQILHTKEKRNKENNALKNLQSPFTLKRTEQTKDNICRYSW